MPQKHSLDTHCDAVVAIPACNEAGRIADCLSALATQRDEGGAPVDPHVLGILLFANNCSDSTVVVAEALRSVVPFQMHVVQQHLPPHLSHAGGARKIAMDLAADWLETGERRNGVIMTTDADSCVSSTWVARTLSALRQGVDAVAGYIEAEPRELLRLGPAFLNRGRLEDRYLAQIAEIYALCDGEPHDPWPNHRVASGASLAVTLASYRAIGGLPPRPVGEDGALVEALRLAGMRVRHAMDVTVTTSCRFDGRARGGAADTMRARHLDPDAPCDADVEPFRMVLRRAVWKGAMRRWYDHQSIPAGSWDRRLLLDQGFVGALARSQRSFERFWRVIENASPRLAQCQPLRPSALAGQIDHAARVIERIRQRADVQQARTAVCGSGQDNVCVDRIWTRSTETPSDDFAFTGPGRT